MTESHVRGPPKASKTKVVFTARQDHDGLRVPVGYLIIFATLAFAGLSRTSPDRAGGATPPSNLPALIQLAGIPASSEVKTRVKSGTSPDAP